MKIKNLVIVMILAIFLLTAANCGGAKFNQEELGKEDFVSLFNGKDLAGWINGPDNMVSRLPKWTSISGRNLIGIRTAPRTNSHGHLRTLPGKGISVFRTTEGLFGTGTSKSNDCKNEEIFLTERVLDSRFSILVEHRVSSIEYRVSNIESACQTPAANKSRKAYSLVPDPHGMVLKAPDGRVVFRYMTKKPKVTNLAANSVCCFHPLNTPSGERLTDLAPGDHHHHRGVFLAWHTMGFREKADFSSFGPLGPTYGWNISRGDFWGWGEFAPTKGRVIKNREVKLVKANSEVAELKIRNDWVTNEKVMMTEVTSAKVREQNGVYVIDLNYKFTPVVDLILNHTAFGGFCVRTRNDGESYYATRDGRVLLPDPHYSVPELNWPAANWYDYTIKLNNGKTIGCAVLDHPDNPPSTWHNPRYIWMVNPCIAAAGPFTVEKGDSLSLRYRLVVHDGPTPVDLLERLSNEWQALSSAMRIRDERDFVRLDNGKDLTGWKGNMRDWSVVHGAIHLHYKSPPSGGVLFSEKSHSDNVIIRMQFRATYAADSGAFVHGSQFQVRDYINSYPDTKKYAPYCNPPGVWNDLEFDITNGVAVVRLNGTVMQRDWKIGTRINQGIGLQKEKGDFDFRYIRLKEKK